MTHIKNPFSVETSTLPADLIIDRSQALNTLFNNVFARRENALIFGEHGIGKTCLLRKLREKLKVYDQSVLIVTLDMVSLSSGSSEFLFAVIQKLMQETWVTVLGRKYSELLTQGFDTRSKLDKHLQRQIQSFIELFRIMRAQLSVHGTETSARFGGTVPITATKTEKSSSSFSINGLHPSEFIHLAGECISILETRGIKQIIVFGDEANHVKPEIEIDLFRCNFEAFSRRNVQFVFAANRRTVEQVPKLKEVFPVLIDLKGFEAKETLDEMLSVYTSRMNSEHGGIAFSPEVIERLWRITKGYPREIQRICQRCVELALSKGLSQIGTDILLDACIDRYEITSTIRCD